MMLVFLDNPAPIPLDLYLGIPSVGLFIILSVLNVFLNSYNGPYERDILYGGEGGWT